MLYLILALALGQDPVADSAKRVQAAAKSLADARATTAQLIAALEAAQAEVVKASKELDDASVALVKAQAGVRAGQLDAEKQAIEAMRALVQPGAPVKPIIPKMKDPPKKGLFDTEISATTLNFKPDIPPSTLPKVGGPLELSAAPATHELVWMDGGDGNDYLWLGDNTLASAPKGQRSVEKMRFMSNGKWRQFPELKGGSDGRPGWARFLYGATPVISRRNGDAQIMAAGKWHWIP